MTLPGRVFIASALGLLAGSGLADAYNSEEHKILVDWGASMVRPHPSVTLPFPTRFHGTDLATRQQSFKNAKILAVGFDTNDPNDYDDQVEKVQDNSYWYGYGWKQVLGNKELYIPPTTLLRETTLVIRAETTTGATTVFTIGELAAIYGDYRRTTWCDTTSGICYLTNTNTPTTDFAEGYDCFGLDCGFRPLPVNTTTYLRHIGSGLWPPYACLQYTAHDDEWEEAGWWGDEMVRIAMTNDWHFSSAAVAWYVGMHRLALLYVDRARSDPKYWNLALHYEANGLHSLTDLFAFGHVVTNRDRTSWEVTYASGMTTHPSYQWMENVIRTGGGSRDDDNDGNATDGRITLAVPLPQPFVDRDRPRNEFMAVATPVAWSGYALQEKDFHDAYNHGGATVRNLKGDRFYIRGDGELRRGVSQAARPVVAEAVRASLQSLFDAYVRLAGGETVAQIGAAGGAYFEALKNIPVFIESNDNYSHQQDGECYPAGTAEPTGHNYDGRWTRFAAFANAVTGANVVPANASNCLVRYEDGEQVIAGPVSNPSPCTTFPTIVPPPPPPPPPTVVHLAPSRPNPANETTLIEYAIPVESHVRIEIFDSRGASVRMLEDGVRPAAVHSVTWDGRDGEGNSLAAGVYYYRLTVPGHDMTRKVVLLR